MDEIAKVACVQAESVAFDRAATIEKLLLATSRTSHWLLATSLIMSSPSITERLLLLFALYGERWGKVTPDGVRIKRGWPSMRISPSSGL